MKILFVYDHKYPETWKDGLWAALNLLEKDGFEIVKMNLQSNNGEELTRHYNKKYDFALGWGAFNSPVDNFMQTIHQYPSLSKIKIGLCIAGNSFPPDGMENYDILFYETNWTLKEYLGPYINTHPGIKTEVVRAFGINSDIYRVIPDAIKIFDWITVGSFSLWKRHYLFKEKGGYRLAIGEIQRENMSESINIVGDLLLSGIAVSDMVEPEKLAFIYNSADKTFIGADINGGGERSCWEAKACGVKVECSPDNPKILELINSKVQDYLYYAKKLKDGIESIL